MSRVREGTVIASKYRIERALARGGMGSIWVARHVPLDMPVAIKFMDGQFASTPEGRTRFDREARAVAMIQSPHVVHIHDYGIHEGWPYMAMELLHGEDLGARIRREHRLSLGAIADVFGQACKALRKAHEAGIIHRDLKPANVFIVRDDDGEIVKVLDFGVAKMIGLGEAGESTRTGVVVGSVHYMSPEQARGMKDIDPRADLWSVGIMAFRALTGHLPFPGDQVGDVIVKICSEPIPRASSFRADLGPDVDAFFTRALARRPDERYQTARDLAAALAVLAGGPRSIAPSFTGVAPNWAETPLPAPSVAPAPGAYADSAAPFSADPVSSMYVEPDPPTHADQPRRAAPLVSEPSLAPPPLWQGPPLGTITRATQSSDVIVPPRAPRNAGLAVVIAVAALCGVALVVGGTALVDRVMGHAASQASIAAPSATSASAVTPASSPETAAAPSASAAPTTSAEPSAAPATSAEPSAEPAATVAPTAPAEAAAVPPEPAARAPASSPPSKPARPAKAAPARKINSELGF